MKFIQLPSGHQVKVDDEDFGEVSKYKWHLANGYPMRHVAIEPDTREYMHRFINKTPKGLVTDHINGDKLDNRRSNLRNATISQNGANTLKRRSYDNPTKGVSWFGPRRCWRARLQKQTIGYYKTPEDAARAYREAVLDKYGEFARVGYI